VTRMTGIGAPRLRRLADGLTHEMVEAAREV
jgi:hypothetical protein